MFNKSVNALRKPTIRLLLYGDNAGKQTKRWVNDQRGNLFVFIITAWLNFHLMEMRYVYRKSVNVLKPFFISSSAYEGVLINKLLNTVN